MSTGRLDFCTELIQEAMLMFKQRIQEIHARNILKFRLADDCGTGCHGHWARGNGFRAFHKGHWRNEMEGFEGRNHRRGHKREWWRGKREWHEGSDNDGQFSGHSKVIKKAWKRWRKESHEMNDKSFFQSASNWHDSGERGGDFFKEFRRRHYHRFHHSKGWTGCHARSSYRRDWKRNRKMPFWRSNTAISRTVPIQYSLNRIAWSFLHHENYFSNLYDDRLKSRNHWWWWAVSLSPKFNVKPASELLKYLWRRPDAVHQISYRKSSSISSNAILGSRSGLAAYLRKGWLSRQVQILAAFRTNETVTSVINEIDAFAYRSIDHWSSEAASSTVEFDLKPSAAMCSSGDLTTETLAAVEEDVEAFIASLRTKMVSLKRIASLGELPLSIENGVIKVHFPNADVDKVRSLLSDVEALEGVIHDTTGSEESTNNSGSSVSGSSDYLSSTGSRESLFGSSSFDNIEHVVPSLTNGTSESCASEVLSCPSL